jgi:membrane fusion protein (multidrug efflux system)
MRNVILITTLLVLAGIVYLAVTRFSPGVDSAGTQTTPPVAVAVVTAKEELWRPTIKATGSLRAFQGVNVTVQEAGMITSIPFESGTRVSKGDLLVQQYVEDEEVRLNGLKSELSLARKSYDRSQSLIGKQAVSQSQLDSTLSDLERMTALVENLEVSIAKRSVKAPFDGILGIRQVNVGQYIEPGDHIVTLEALDPIYVEFALPQNRLTQARIGQEVTIESDAYPGVTFTATINAIEPLIDRDTRTFNIQAEIPNTDLKLRSGMFVNTHLNLPVQDNVLTLPQAAISYNPYGDSVFAVRSGTDGGRQNLVAETVYVTLGETRGDQVAILSGLKPGDRVVTAGQLRLQNGSAVTINENVVMGNSAEPEVDDS